MSLCVAALELWRGAPFGDAAECSTLDDEAARLEELRVALVEHAHVRRLAAGAGGELIADLSQLVKEHPLREGLWSSLIVAEYRAGQQAEALRTYERLRAQPCRVAGARSITPSCRTSSSVCSNRIPICTAARRPDAAVADTVSLPTGTVTFLLSDVEGSTRRWEQAPRRHGRGRGASLRAAR